MAIKIRDKHLKLDQVKLDQVRRLLGAKTERTAIEQALDLVLSKNVIKSSVGTIPKLCLVCFR